MKYLIGIMVVGIIMVGIFTGLQAKKMVREINGRQQEIVRMLK